MSKKIDKKISDYLESLDDKVKKLGQKPMLSYKTDAMLISNNDVTNLNTINDKYKIIGLYSKILLEKSLYDQACSELGSDIDFKIGQYKADDWLSDLKTRFKYIQWNEDKKSLEQAKNKLKESYSEGAKKEDFVNSIAKELGL